MKVIDIPNARTPAEGILSGGQPSSAQLAAAQAAGYRSVINLRNGTEPGVASWGEAVVAQGLAYHHLPIAGGAGITKENALAFAELLDAAAKPAIAHCGSGNRIGALAALIAFHQDGKGAAEALSIGRAWGLTGLEPVVRKQLGI